MAQICLPFGSNFSKAVGASQFWFDPSTTWTRGNIYFFPSTFCITTESKFPVDANKKIVPILIQYAIKCLTFAEKIGKHDIFWRNDCLKSNSSGCYKPVKR